MTRAPLPITSPSDKVLSNMTVPVHRTSGSFEAPERDESFRRPATLKLTGSNIALQVMIHRGFVSKLRPLVILNSVEFPMPPSIEFCEHMWREGFQVIYMNRPGFGASTQLPKVLYSEETILNGATAAAEAALIQKMLCQLDLDDVVLLGMGSANPVCYRLSLLAEEVALSVYSNVVFNKDIFDVFRPKWLQQMFRQMVQSRAGLRITMAGIKFRLRRKPLDFYHLLMHQSAGDVAYLEANPADFVSAGRIFQSVSQSTIDCDMRMSLTPDSLLKDGLFEHINAIAFSGTETPDHWQTQLNSEADRLGIKVAYAPNGDFLAPYASPDFFVETLNTHLGARRSRQSKA